MELVITEIPLVKYYVIAGSRGLRRSYLVPSFLHLVLYPNMKCVELAPDLVPAKRIDIKAKSAQVHFQHFTNDTETRMQLEMSRTGDYSDDAADCIAWKGKFEQLEASLGSEELIHCDENNGIFSAALHAYNKHWKLRTSPDDWWFCVIKRVSLAIDANGNKNAVRKLFVNHEGQKTLSVAVPNATVHGIDYSLFFNQMANEIARNIKVPKYVEAVTADFTTTTPNTKIVSQMTIMSSVKKYFWFSMVCIVVFLVLKCWALKKTGRN